MKIVGRAAPFTLRSIFCWLAVFCAWGISAAWAAKDATPSPITTAPAAATTPMPVGMHGIIQLDGPWRFQIGDDPRWADPNFDDSSWPTATLGKTLADQGFESYAGYGWYRLRVQAQQFHLGGPEGNSPVHLLVTSHSVGQLAVYINGAEVGHTCGMTDKPSMYESPPFEVTIPQDVKGDTIVLAIRSWAAPGVPITHGLLERIEAGTHDDIADRLTLAVARKWYQQIIAELVLSFLFLGVAVLGAILYMAQRHHSEYLWLALMCLAVAVTGAIELFHWLALISSAVFDVLNLWTGRIFMAVTLEFVVRFTTTEKRQVVRYFQAFVLVLPFLSLLGLQPRFFPSVRKWSSAPWFAFCYFAPGGAASARRASCWSRSFWPPPPIRSIPFWNTSSINTGSRSDSSHTTSISAPSSSAPAWPRTWSFSPACWP